MKRPLVGMVTAGIVSVVVAGGGYAAQADELFESAPRAFEENEGAHEPPDRGYGYDEYREYEDYGDHNRPEEYREYENYGDRDGHDSYGHDPGGPESEEGEGAENGDPFAADHPPEAMDGESGQDAPPEEGVLPEQDVLPGGGALPEDQVEADAEAAPMLPVTGGPFTALALFGGSALVAGIALLGVARRLRYKPRH